MYPLKSVIVNDFVFEVERHSFKNHPKNKSRNLVFGGEFVEKNYLSLVSDFVPENSSIFKLLNNIFGDHFLNSHNMILIARLFEILTPNRLNREVYRRKKTIYFWLNQHITEFKAILRDNRMTFIVDQDTYFKLTPVNSIIHVIAQRISGTMKITTEKTVDLMNLTMNTLRITHTSASSPQQDVPQDVNTDVQNSDETIKQTFKNLLKNVVENLVDEAIETTLNKNQE